MNPHLTHLYRKAARKSVIFFVKTLSGRKPSLKRLKALEDYMDTRYGS